MTEAGFFVDTGKPSFTNPARKWSFCRRGGCCPEIADVLNVLAQLEEGSSGPPPGGTPGSGTVLACASATIDRIAPNVHRWEGDLSFPGCVLPDPIPVVFECTEETASNDPEDCTQILRLTVNGNIVPLTECCCFNSNPSLPKNSQGPTCYVGSFGPVWTGGRDPQDNCPGGPWLNENDGSFPIIWLWEPVMYPNIPCCQPTPCPDVICPSNPCVEMLMARSFAYQPPFPKRLEKWLT